MDEARTRAPPVRPARPESMTPLYDLPRRSSRGVATGTTPPLPVPVPGSGPGLTKKRKSSVNVRAVSQSHNKLPVQNGHGSVRYSIGASTLGSEKKGSFRNAVRKLFGRKSKVEEEVPVQRSPPRHGYHRSDPGNYPKPPTITDYPAEAIPQRTLSAPLHVLNPHEVRQVRSPNAVEFPKSARLKPLDLGNPFYTRAHQPKRRATLPSLIMADREAAALGAAIAGYEARAAGMSFDIPREMPESEIGVAITSTAANEKRRSRSAYNLRNLANEAQPPRKRSEDIRYWRTSYTGSVLLNPALHAARAQSDDEDETDLKDVTPHAVMINYSQSPDTITSRPTTSAGMPSSALFGSSSRPVTAGGETSRDLEFRVAKLECSILEFQQSLERITLTSRSPPPRSPPIHAPRAIRRQHTPSMLVDTLQHPSWRRPPPLDQHERFFQDAAESPEERVWGGTAPSERSARPTLPASSNDAITAHNISTSSASAGNGGTFTALYNMLSEERSARRALESQVRHLQHEVSALAHPRVGHSSWSSFPVPGGPLMHHHRPRTPEESDRGASSRGGLSPSPQRVVSRFSATSAGTGESEAWRVQPSLGRLDVSALQQQQQPNQEHAQDAEEEKEEGEEAQTPYELYSTPVEESHPYPYTIGGGGALRREEEDMF